MKYILLFTVLFACKPKPPIVAGQCFRIEHVGVVRVILWASSCDGGVKYTLISGEEGEDTVYSSNHSSFRQVASQVHCPEGE